MIGCNATSIDCIIALSIDGIAVSFSFFCLFFSGDMKMYKLKNCTRITRNYRQTALIIRYNVELDLIIVFGYIHFSRSIDKLVVNNKYMYHSFFSKAFVFFFCNKRGKGRKKGKKERVDIYFVFMNFSTNDTR